MLAQVGASTFKMANGTWTNRLWCISPGGIVKVAEGFGQLGQDIVRDGDISRVKGALDSSAGLFLNCKVFSSNCYISCSFDFCTDYSHCWKEYWQRSGALEVLGPTRKPGATRLVSRTCRALFNFRCLLKKKCVFLAWSTFLQKDGPFLASLSFFKYFYCTIV